MDRIPPLTAFVALALCGNAGCLTAEKAQSSYTSLKQSVGLEQPQPVSQMMTIWDPRLGTLSDPTRDGATLSGLVGQVFMLTPKDQPAEARGDLSVVLYDTTPRPAGQPERPGEMYHLTQETLVNLRTKDERFGLFYAMFLPWPAEWTDVTHVKVMAGYQPPGGTAIQAREVPVQLQAERAKFTTEVQNFQRVGGAMLPEPPAAPRDRRGVPDPLKMIAAMQGKPAAAPPPVAGQKLPAPEAFMRSNVPAADDISSARNAPPVTTAVARTPVVTPLPPGSNTTYATEGAYAGPKPGGPGPLAGINPAAANGPVQPIVIRRE